MKRILNYFIALALMMGIVLGLSPIVVSAANEDLPAITIVSPPSADKDAIQMMVINCNTRIHDAGIFTADSALGVTAQDFLFYEDASGGNINVRINTTEYNKLKQGAKQDVMQLALSEIYNSSISRTNKNKIYNELCSYDSATSSLVRQLSNDVNADFYEAYKYFKPFSGVLGVILGLFSIVIFALLGLTICVDIAFMTIPFIQNSLMSGSEDKVKFVSLEAVSAVKESESKVGGSDYKSPVQFYLKSKSKQLVAISICLLYLVSGQIYNVLAQIIDYFSGIIGY